jgi:chromosome partitioning protein
MASMLQFGRKNAHSRTEHAMIIAFANQKGGVGKTTTAVNLAGFIAATGRRILLVDLDPQGNAATCLGIAKSDLRLIVGDVLLGSASIAEVILPAGRPGYDLLPSTVDLAGMVVELADIPRWEYRLHDALREVDDYYEYILIDCPPSLGQLTINGLVAADQVIIPLQCEYLALEGLAQLKQTIELVRDRLNPRLHIGGVVMTMYDGRVNLAQQVVEEVRRYFPHRLFDTLIPRNIRLSEAPSHGELIAEYDPQSRGARAYQSLADEVLRRERVPL